MTDISFLDFDFLEIHFENLETIKFPINHIEQLKFFHLSSKDNFHFSSNSFELIIKNDNATEGNNIFNRASKRIYQQSDICSFYLIKKNTPSDTLFIDVVWDDSNPFNLQFNYWQDVEFLENKNLKIFNSPNVDQSKVSTRIELFRQSHFKTNFDMTFFNETLSDLEKSFLSLNSDDILSDQKEKILDSINKLQQFSNNTCFDYSFLGKK